MTESEVLASVEAALLEHFGGRPQRASMSFVGVDPIEVLRFEPIPGERSYVTLGMSRQPMTGAFEAFRDYTGPRTELVLELRDPVDEHADVWRRLALLAAAPAVEAVVYSNGMTVDIGAPLTPGSRCTGAVIVESAIGEVATSAGPVTVLRAVPATSTELAWCRVHGSAELVERWTRSGTDMLDLTRAAVDLK